MFLQSVLLSLIFAGLRIHVPWPSETWGVQIRGWNSRESVLYIKFIYNMWQVKTIELCYPCEQTVQARIVPTLKFKAEMVRRGLSCTLEWLKSVCVCISWTIYIQVSKSTHFLKVSMFFTTSSHHALSTPPLLRGCLSTFLFPTSLRCKKVRDSVPASYLSKVKLEKHRVTNTYKNTWFLDFSHHPVF
jgi:hypothetical protein